MHPTNVKIAEKIRDKVTRIMREYREREAQRRTHEKLLFFIRSFELYKDITSIEELSENDQRLFIEMYNKTTAT